MTEPFVANSYNLSLYLPDGTWLPGKDARLSIDVHSDPPAIELSVTLDALSAGQLDASGVLDDDLELPELDDPLATFWVDLNLIAGLALSQQFVAFLREDEQPALAILQGHAPVPAGQSVSPFYMAAEYRLDSWAIREVRTYTPDDFDDP